MLAATSLTAAPATAAGAAAAAPAPNAALADTLGQYAGTVFSPTEATRMAALLTGSVSVTRSLNPPGYLEAAPASIYRIPAAT